MKKYALILFLAMVGCQKSQLGGDEPSTIEPFIKYKSRVEATSKAAPTNLDGLKNDGFAITSILNNGSERALYYTDAVSFTDGVWKSPLNRYWPVNGSLDFFAYSPMGKDFVEINKALDPYGYSMTYTCPQNIDDQIDLLVTSKMDLSAPTDKDDNPDPVDLDFIHALSSIAFEVEIEGESNITLDQIIINYVNIEKKRTYDFIAQKWNEPLEADKIYFDKTDGLSTYLNVNEKQTLVSGHVVFDNIANQLMIIPQDIDHVNPYTRTPHYISVQVVYTLHNSDKNTTITTGVMPLPAPTSENNYEQGHVYTYKLKVNGKTIQFDIVDIDDQKPPKPAFGNIDLALIPITSVGTNYNETAKRVEELFRGGVLDFVVVGSLGANDDPDHTLGDGKLGYYGAETSPFNIGAIAVGGSKDAFKFSVDLRGTYGYPKFKNANKDDAADPDASVDAGSDISPDDDTFNAGLFKEVDGLIEIMLPNGIMAIGNHAFENCDNLTSIDIAQVKHIEIGTFQTSKALKTVYNGNLTRIHNNAFKDCLALTTIDLSKVTKIGASAFTECAQLTNVNLSTLESIAEFAFHGCSNLTLESGTNFKDGCFQEVHQYAFFGCHRLGENGSLIDLTHTTKVEKHAFDNCKHIRLTSGYLGDLTSVGDYAFSNCELIGQSVNSGGDIFYHDFEIPRLNSLGTAAFENCKYLNIIDGFDYLTSIPAYAFQNCTSFTGYAADDPTKVLSLPEVTEVMENGLYNTSITSVNFSDNLTTLGDNAFGSCENLATLSSISKVTSVGNSAFSGCTSLTELSLPLLTDENCGGGFFFNCKSLKKLSLPLLTDNDISWLDGDGSHESKIISMINADFTAIEEIDLQSLIADIPDWHFQGKPNLKKADFASATSVGAGAFAACSKLTDIDVSAATSVGDYAFQDCTALTELDLAGVAAFNKDIISGCTSLETLILSGITGSFGGWQFFNSYTALKNIDLSSVSTLISMTFQDNKSIVAVDLRSATTVESMAFQNCTSLEKLNLSGISDPSQVIEGAFWGLTNGTCDIWLSEEQATAAKAAGNWWEGVEWKNVYAPSDGVPFPL